MKNVEIKRKNRVGKFTERTSSYSKDQSGTPGTPPYPCGTLKRIESNKYTVELTRKNSVEKVYRENQELSSIERISQRIESKKYTVEL